MFLIAIERLASAAGPSAQRVSAHEPAIFPELTDIGQVEPDFFSNVTAGAYYAHPDPAGGEYSLEEAAGATACPGAVLAGCPAGAPAARTPPAASLNPPAVSLSNPVALTEDPATGDIYVSELGVQKHTLLLPSSGALAVAFATAGGSSASAAPTTLATTQSTIRPVRTRLRSAGQSQALRAAVEAQIAADKAKTEGEVTTATASIMASSVTVTKAIRADRSRLKAARFSLRHVGTPVGRKC